jgi:hypothetical protein
MTVSQLSGNVDNLIKGSISTVFNVVLFLSVCLWLLESFDNQGQGRGTTFFWACLFLMFRINATLRPCQSLVALVMSSPTLSGDRPRGPVLGTKTDVCQPYHWYTSQVHDFDLAKVDLGQHGGGATVRTTQESYTPASSE